MIRVNLVRDWPPAELQLLPPLAGRLKAFLEQVLDDLRAAEQAGAALQRPAPHRSGFELPWG
jgi:hypothetical protein